MKLANGLISACIVAAVGTSIYGLADKPAAGKKKILMYSESLGFRHSCVTRPPSGELSDAEKALKEFAGAAGYQVSFSQDWHDLDRPEAYKKYDAIIFYTTGNPRIHREGLFNYVREGGAFIGIHCATDTFYDGNACCTPACPEYTKMIGGAFGGHDQQQVTAMKIEDSTHPATRHLPSDWRLLEEIYRIKEFSRDNVHGLMSVDTERMSDDSLRKLGMKKGNDYPVSWTRTEGKGRVFYTSLGHREDVWTNPLWQKHVLGGLAWAINKDSDK